MEMALDGWKFLVLSPAYAIHWGFQEKNQQSKVRKMQVNKNRQRFSGFEKEVRAKYAARNTKGASIPFDVMKNKSNRNGAKLKDNYQNTKKRPNKKKIEIKFSSGQANPVTKALLDKREYKSTYKPMFDENDFADIQFGDNLI